MMVYACWCSFQIFYNANAVFKSNANVVTVIWFLLPPFKQLQIEDLFARSRKMPKKIVQIQGKVCQESMVLGLGRKSGPLKPLASFKYLKSSLPIFSKRFKVSTSVARSSTTWPLNQQFHAIPAVSSSKSSNLTPGRIFCGSWSVHSIVCAASALSLAGCIPELELNVFGPHMNHRAASTGLQQTWLIAEHHTIIEIL